jgi:diguanylate cyclase (GGDEF)-like protein
MQSQAVENTVSALRMTLRNTWRPYILVLLPALLWLGHTAIGDAGLIAVAIIVALLLALVLPDDVFWHGWHADRLTGLAGRDRVVAALNRSLRSSARRGGATGAITIEIDGFRTLEERHSRREIEQILRFSGNRIRGVLRERDCAGRLEGACFAVALSGDRRVDLEAAIQLSTRIQHALAEPFAIDDTNFYLTASVGFSLAARLADPTGESILQSAITALVEAQRSGPSAIRSYSAAMHTRIASRSALTQQVSAAMERGEIRGYFQPQISTRTGALTGFETLARWQHPERGLIPPVEFLPALDQAGLMGRLGEVMLSDALTALRRWDGLGLGVPRVGVNFSTQELRDPRLVERIGWELDRFDLTADRLVIEVLETVVAGRTEDNIVRNLAGLARLGCSLDLDDFGTGHASITSIRRFSIERIKIDRSFVTRIDEDPEQQNMVGAILTMAERLGLDTLAEGVETTAERAMLARLGCGHIQGFGIGRPMPSEETDGWISTYLARQSGVVALRRAAV